MDDAVAEGTSSRLGVCQVCEECDAKYTCPGCEIKTCSLQCVRIHKEEIKCDGERNRTAYKHLSKFTNLDLLSDYRLLEEMSRSVESYNKDPLKYVTRMNKQLPRHLFKLYEALQRRETKIMFLPQNFSRHKVNTTYFDWKTKIISWRIEWIFPQASELKIIDERLNENTQLSSAIGKYIENSGSSSQDCLQFYQSAGLNGIVLLLKAEKVKKSATRFYLIDSHLTIKKALKKKTIIEFPVIYVVLKDHKYTFEVIDSDEEEMEDAPVESEQSKNNNSSLEASSGFSKNVKKKRKGEKSLLFNDCDSSDLSSDDEGKKVKHPKKDSENGINNTTKQELVIPSYYDLVSQT